MSDGKTQAVRAALERIVLRGWIRERDGDRCLVCGPMRKGVSGPERHADDACPIACAEEALAAVAGDDAGDGTP